MKKVEGRKRIYTLLLQLLPPGRMFVCGGTGAGLKYLDSAEALDDQSGETA